MIGLILSGFVFAAILQKHEAMIGCATIASFPLVLFIDLMLISMNLNNLAGASHNLWPFSLIAFTVYAIPGLIGALSGQLLGRKLWPDKQAHSDDLTLP